MTTHDNERLQRLQKRLDWLRTRVYKAGDKDLSFDKAEASALEWAMGIVEVELGVREKGCAHNWRQLRDTELLHFYCTKCLGIKTIT